MLVSEPALRILNRDEVVRAASELDVVDTVRATLLLHASGDTTLPGEAYLAWQTPTGAPARSLALPGAVWGPRPAIGLKVINSSLDNPGRGMARAQGWTFLFDQHTARPVAMLEAAWLSATRTAAYTVLSHRLLGNDGCDRIAVIGCGALADAHLRLLTAELPKAEIVLHDLDPRSAETLAERWSASVAPDARRAVEGAGLVVCATTTTTGYLAHDWLAPGALVAHVSLDDLTPDAIMKSDLLVVDDWDLVAADDRRVLGRMFRRGEITGPAGERHPAGGGPAGRRVDATMADVLAGRHPGRTSAADIVLSNPFGMGILDVALAAQTHEVAASRGLGTVLPAPVPEQGGAP
jgi:ornithine cyclodeaminase